MVIWGENEIIESKIEVWSHEAETLESIPKSRLVGVGSGIVTDDWWGVDEDTEKANK